ncbi:uncharacterized protein C11orf16 homolog [Stegastes partitus]|uniref:Uncharacterized protein C11orf16 homolog n=1 Tax=Stegastes partitus TaxID=144197 RepID=A0A9Y4KFY9_9TELE|nr:PREDICTED: uncharacterized protein C11orf16 homolog [Stegastes partitus]
MTSRQTQASEAALIPLFLGKQRCNITFVLDSSDNMRAVLGSVKRLLIQTLLTKASLRDSLFNIVTFSSQVNCWSPHMRGCAPDTVYTALSWIHSISCSPGRDLLAALSVALTNPLCQAIHLLCTDLLEQPEALLRALPGLAAGRPVNIFYLQDSGSELDRNARDYLQCLTQSTRGSCYMIPFDLNGVLEKVIPLYVAKSRSSVPTVSPAKCCWSHHTPSSLFRCSLGNQLHPFTSCMLPGQSLAGPQFFPGCRVLARREMDGLYYLATVIQQVQGRRGVWMIEFDHPGSVSSGVVSSKCQLVCSLDMVNDSRAQSHCLVPGDVVLSPWEPNLKRFGPGRVIAATEHRDSFRADAVTSLRVLMWNSCVSLVPGSLVLPVSASHYDRIVRELQIQTPAPSPYCSRLCARSSSCTPQMFCTDCCQSASASCCCSVSNRWPYIAPHSCRASLGGSDRFDRAEQHKQVNLRNADVRKDDSSSSSSSSSSSLSEDETRASNSPAMKLNSKQQRPPWKYWRRTGPEPQHRQPGSAPPRRSSQPFRFSFSVPQISTSPNHSSLFQSLSGSKERRGNIRDVFGMTHFKPRPPVGLQSFTGNKATTIHT